MIVPSNLTYDEVNSLILSALDMIHRSGPTSGEVLETISYLKELYPQQLAPYESTLMYELGLFYKTIAPNSMLELVYDTYKNIILDSTGKVYSPTQFSELKNISDHSVFSFSAPTSSGKSHVFLDLLKESAYDIVIVLPSRALIAEYLQKLKASVLEDVLVLQFVDNINIANTRRRIFVITPERAEELFDQYTHLNIQLVLFDEAQISEDSVRGLRFDALVRRINQKMPHVKIVFAHPFIKNPEVQIGRNQLETRDNSSIIYNQQNVGKIFLYKDATDQYYYFSPYTEEKAIRTEDVIYNTLVHRKGTVLIYVAKTHLYSTQFITDYKPYLDICPEVDHPGALQMIAELRDYLGGTTVGEDKSLILELMKHGVVIHHGSMPLRARFLIEQFVNAGYAKICFATSTLIQGINMPFDVVWVDHFDRRKSENRKILDFKNLIGRAGRTSGKQNCFDYGYVVINENHRSKVKEYIVSDALLSSDSLINAPIETISDDIRDIVEAVQTDTFDSHLQITESQKIRLVERDAYTDIAELLDRLFVNGRFITGNAYQKLPSGTKTKIKQLFQSIFVKHLRRDQLTRAEKSVLSTAISIMLWRVQGRAFKEIIALRKRYIFNMPELETLKRAYRNKEITLAEYNDKSATIGLRYTSPAAQLPNSGLRSLNLFPSPDKYSYDVLMYDTYDYLDKVIGFSLSAPISAALLMYFRDTQDERAERLANFIRFGTDDYSEIMLQRYGFVLDDMDWLLPCIDHVDENRILFNLHIFGLDEKQYDLIKRYIFDR